MQEGSPQQVPKTGASYILGSENLHELLCVLRTQEYEVIGPAVSDGAIVYRPLAPSDQLPVGWTQEQRAGSYRLQHSTNDALFSYVVGPHSWKKFLYPPTRRLWRAQKKAKGFHFSAEEPPNVKYAFIGVRACDLTAIAIQDQIFLEGQYVDSDYQARRKDLLIIAVNCLEPGGTCFCASVNTGPKAASGFDLALTELQHDGRHFFLVEVGTQTGAEILSQVRHEEAGESDRKLAERALREASLHMGRSLETRNLKALLNRNFESAQWDNLAERCLTCGNCTMVCPTCFCSTVEDTTDLSGSAAERWRRWDSCFTADFSYIHGRSVRTLARSRHRQWMMHKLATWIDQFGRSGCVGCGRCITWCPVGIDITAEARILRENDTTSPEFRITQELP